MSDARRRIPERVADIREAMANIRDDIGPLDRAAFTGDGKTQRAVIESLIVIGEAANAVMRMAPDLAERETLLWQHLKDIYDMRIVLTHQYFRVDPGIVWDTLVVDLPAFESLLSRLDSWT